MWKCGLCCEKYDEVSFVKDDRFGGKGEEIAVCDNCLDSEGGVLDANRGSTERN